MRRRNILALTGAAVALAPIAARAQPAKVAVIGMLVVAAPSAPTFGRLFRDAMRRLGYVEGRTVRYELRSDDGQLSRLPELAAELVRLKVDVIVAYLTPAALAAKQATRDIPIVMGAAGDPLAAGLIDSLARPGGNVTGVSNMASDAAGKCVELSRELLPHARRVAALTNAPDPFSKPFLEKIRVAGAATGTTIDVLSIREASELEAVFASLDKAPPDTMILQASLPTKLVAELAIKHKIPSLSITRSFPEAGGLMSYAAEGDDLYRSVAGVVDKILKGAKPADLPVAQPTKFELVINLKTAKAIGLTIPTPLFQRADELIE
jgi:putative tryptophan/tyrosine transport system substrate-binding protein